MHFKECVCVLLNTFFDILWTLRFLTELFIPIPSIYTLNHLY